MESLSNQLLGNFELEAGFNELWYKKEDFNFKTERQTESLHFEAILTALCGQRGE